MKYMGSKSKIAKSLLALMLKNRTANQVFVEPFVGGCNVIDKVVGERIGCDNNKYLIAMYKYLQNNPAPNFDQSKQHYNEVRQAFKDNNTSKFSEAYIGYVGFMASANGRFFDGGYSGKSSTKIGTVRDYIDESIRGLDKQIPSLKGIDFVCVDYKDLIIPPKVLFTVTHHTLTAKNTQQGILNPKNFGIGVGEWLHKVILCL